MRIGFAFTCSFPNKERLECDGAVFSNQAASGFLTMKSPAKNFLKSSAHLFSRLRFAQNQNLSPKCKRGLNLMRTQIVKSFLSLHLSSEGGLGLVFRD